MKRIDEFDMWPTLTAHDFHGPVMLCFEDGSIFAVTAGFAVSESLDRGGVLVPGWAVYTEHNGYHWFHRGAVAAVHGEIGKEKER